jgi:FKBP-type peptidyl-prolyl cis-trans isomerase
MEMQSKQMAKMKTDGEKNVKDGEAFLAANKAKKGVIVTATGLQYSVIKEGTGPVPKVTDMVKVHYRGTLIDGKEFDSSIKRGQPVEFRVNGVIPGWTEALQLMKTGSKYKLVIPSNLGYGERGAGQDIGPNAVLVFDVELLEIVQGK